MKLLLDTHALLWWLSDSDRVGKRVRDLIADPANDVLVSVASLWEIVVKVRMGKLVADVDDISTACQRGGFNLLDINQAHLRKLSQLAMHHRDPFDHLLIAQAFVEQATFVSDDRNTAQYGVNAISCADVV